MKHIIIVKKSEHCFENILGLIISHVAYVTTLATYNEIDLSTILNDGKCHYSGTPSTTNLELVVQVKKEILQISQEDVWPNEIALWISKLRTKNPDIKYPWDVKKGDVFGIWQATATYISFYSKIEPLIEKNYGKNSDCWPNLFNFGRICRNALAHGNKVNITNPNSQTYSWHKLSYGYKDNGRKIIFNDFAFADLIILMKDLSDNL